MSLARPERAPCVDAAPVRLAPPAARAAPRPRARLRVLVATAACAFLFAIAGAACAATIEANQLLPWTRGATPPLALRDLTGAPVDLAAFRGKTVIVNFWATWCVPCREEMPSLAALAKRMPGIAVLAVDVGEAPARVTRFLERYPLPGIAIALDGQGVASEAWGVGIFPSSYIVGADGRVRAYIVGALDWQDAAVVRQVEALAKAPAQ